MVSETSSGFCSVIEIGSGVRASAGGKNLKLKRSFSHQISGISDYFSREETCVVSITGESQSCLNDAEKG